MHAQPSTMRTRLFGVVGHRDGSAWAMVERRLAAVLAAEEFPRGVRNMRKSIIMNGDGHARNH